MNISTGRYWTLKMRYALILQYKQGSHAGKTIKKQRLLLWASNPFQGTTLPSQLFFLLKLQMFRCFFIVADDIGISRTIWIAACSNLQFSL
jgi:hypothetical protein